MINALTKEVRAALLEDGALSEFYVERKGKHGIVGNIYKAKVLKVVPAIQSAFLDIGISRKAFLYVNDIVCFDDFGERSNADIAPIQNTVSVGEELIVQISKEPIGTKGPRVTTNITLPGRYLVLLPNARRIAISRRITDPFEADRLRNIVTNLKSDDCGVIVRTAAVGASKDEIEKDFKYVFYLWQKLKQKAEKRPPPALIYQDFEIIPRILRDMLTDDVDEVLFDSKPEFDRAVSFAKGFIPRLSDRLKLYKGRIPLFESYGVEDMILKALQRKVYLPGGAYIVIDETEALVSIDVNSGKYHKAKDSETTALNVNLLAAREIARQLRLRDIGGIIVIDFIDMKDEDNKELLLSTLKSELLKDRARTEVVSMSDLGLVEMTRKRMRKSLGGTLTMTCPYCEGKGRIKSVETVAFEVERALMKVLDKNNFHALKVYVHPLVAKKLTNDEKDIIEKFRQTFKRDIKVVPVDHYHIEKFDILKT